MIWGDATLVNGKFPFKNNGLLDACWEPGTVLWAGDAEWAGGVWERSLEVKIICFGVVDEEKPWSGGR